MERIRMPENRFLRGIYLMVRRYLSHNVGIQSAALAFYLLFMLFPFLIIISALLGLLQLDVAAILGALGEILPLNPIALALGIALIGGITGLDGSGFSGVPPPGPAMPVIPTPKSAPAARRTPSAISAATCGETAPNCSRVSCFTPKTRSFTSLAYVQAPY